MEDLGPEILDLTINLDELLDAGELDSKVLKPAIEEALSNLITERPDLEGRLPALPSSLDSLVDALSAKMESRNEKFKREGANWERTKISSNDGILDSYQTWQNAMKVSMFTPVVVRYANMIQCDECKDPKWED